MPSSLLQPHCWGQAQRPMPGLVQMGWVGVVAGMMPCPRHSLIQSPCCCWVGWRFSSLPGGKGKASRRRRHQLLLLSRGWTSRALLGWAKSCFHWTPGGSTSPLGPSGAMGRGFFCWRLVGCRGYGHRGFLFCRPTPALAPCAGGSGLFLRLTFVWACWWFWAPGFLRALPGVLEARRTHGEHTSESASKSQAP